MMVLVQVCSWRGRGGAVLELAVVVSVSLLLLQEKPAGTVPPGLTHWTMTP